MNLQLLLSKSEYQVAEEVARGYTEKEIAAKRFVSPKTVHAQTANIRKKTGARGAVDVARFFILSLENPKHFFYCLLFVAIQGFTIIESMGIDMKKPHKITKVSRRYKKQ